MSARALLLLRHAATAWNEAGRIQGRADPGLSDAGRAALAGRALPAAWGGAEWYASPLARAVETARALGACTVREDARLIEMDWGRWQGSTLAALRRRLGEAMRENEARGLDFRPDGGESPREVRARLAGWVASLGAAGPPVAAVTHKGVIRAALSLATGWDMREAFRPRLDWTRAHAFSRTPAGGLALERVNVELAGPAP